MLVGSGPGRPTKIRAALVSAASGPDTSAKEARRLLRTPQTPCPAIDQAREQPERQLAQLHKSATINWILHKCTIDDLAGIIRCVRSLEHNRYVLIGQLNLAVLHASRQQSSNFRPQFGPRESCSLACRHRLKLNFAHFDLRICGLLRTYPVICRSVYSGEGAVGCS